jgi:hypothetical protein
MLPSRLKRSYSNSFFSDGPENTDPASEALVIVIVDFDGTCTGKPGKETINSKCFKRCKLESNEHYSRATLESESNMVAILKEEISEDDSLGIKPTTNAFLTTLFANPNARIHIVSKNRKEYINAVLLAAGFDEGQINNIEIYDIKTGGADKLVTAKEILSSYENVPINAIFIADDDENDFSNLQYAADSFLENQQKHNTQLIAVSGQPDEIDLLESYKDAMESSAPVRGHK